jgi:hypothetical protein
MNLKNPYEEQKKDFHRLLLEITAIPCVSKSAIKNPVHPPNMPNLDQQAEEKGPKNTKDRVQEAPFTDFYDKAAEFMEQKGKHEEGASFFN